MRRSQIFIVALVAGLLPTLLAGCEDERSASIRKDRQAFHEALQLVKLVQQDHVTSGKGLANYKPSEADFSKADVAAAMKTGDLGQFRDSLSDQAEAKLAKLTTTGPASQRVSAARLLANLKMASAHRLRVASNVARNQHSAENGFIASALHSIERADAVSKRRLTGDVAEFVAQLGTDKDGAAAKVGSLKSEQTRLQTEVTNLSKQVADLESQRDAKFEDGRKLRTEGFKASGKQAFDLYVKAIDLEQNGNELETEAQRLRVARDLAKSHLAVTESELALAMAWQKAVDDGLGAAEARKQALSKVETEVSGTRTSAGEQIASSLDIVLKAYRSDVLAPLDQAIADLDDAFKALESTKSQALTTEDKTAMKMRMLATQLEKLQVQDDRLVALGTIGKVVENVYGRAGSMMPGSFEEIKTAVEALRAEQTAQLESSAATKKSVEAVLGEPEIQSLSDSSPLSTARMRVKNAANAYLATHTTVVEANSFSPIGSEPVAPRPNTNNTNTSTPPTNNTSANGEAAKALSAMAKSIAAYKPNEVWDTLPGSYRQDVEGWIHTYGTKMDAELWNAVFTFAKKVVTLLETKKAYILANENISGLMEQAGPEAAASIEKNWDEVVMLLSIIVNSELSDLNKLKTLDMSTFLSGTGSKFMAQLDKVIAITEGVRVIQTMGSTMQFKVVSSQGDTATVEITGTPTPKTEVFQKVQGAWLPKEMVDEWPQMKQEAEAALAQLDPASFEENKAQIMGMLTVIGGMVDNLNQAESQAAFDASVEQIMGLVQGLMGGPAGPPPCN